MCSTRNAFFQTVGNNAAAGRHGAHQMMELALDGGQVVENIGVVEFKVVEHSGAWPVMHKLAALSKNAVSNSSASMTNKGRCGPCACTFARAQQRPNLAEIPKFSGTPPIRKPGARPQHPQESTPASKRSSSCRGLPATASTSPACRTTCDAHGVRWDLIESPPQREHPGS